MRDKEHQQKVSPNDRTPIASIITVVFNGVNSIERTIRSVIDQKQSNIEYIIIDGGSQDGTIDVIKKYESVIDYWISEKDKGIYNAMNKGAGIARGKYITFLNADDVFMKDYLDTFLQYASGNADYFSCGVKMIYSNRTIQWIPPNCNNTADRFYWRMPLPHPGLMVKKHVFDEIGGFNEEYRFAADYDFILKLIRKYKGVFTEKLLVDFYMGGASSSMKILKENNSVRMKHYNSKMFHVIIAHLIEKIKWRLSNLIYR